MFVCSVGELKKIPRELLAGDSRQRPAGQTSADPRPAPELAFGVSAEEPLEDSPRWKTSTPHEAALQKWWDTQKKATVVAAHKKYSQKVASEGEN
jgi:hypothetical protein